MDILRSEAEPVTTAFRNIVRSTQDGARGWHIRMGTLAGVARGFTDCHQDSRGPLPMDEPLRSAPTGGAIARRTAKVIQRTLAYRRSTEFSAFFVGA